MNSSQTKNDPGRARFPRFAIIGGGLGGIAMAVKLKQAGIDGFTVFEKNDGPGGTWWENTYPGAQVDVASSFYSFSFMQHYDWPRSHANQAEVLQYAQDVIDEFGVRAHLRFGARVRQVIWNEANHSYTVHTEAGEALEYDIVVSCVGMLNEPAYPAWPGLADFQGPKFHTARWQHQHDLSGKRVALVGTGSTACQVVSAIAPRVGRLYLFQREPGYVAPKNYHEFSAAERRRLRRWPILQRLRRIRAFLGFERVRASSLTGSKMQGNFHRACLNHIAAGVKDPELRKLVTPAYGFFCKRPILDDFFYPALNRDNVEVVPRAVTRVTRTGIVDAEGVEREVDVLVMATGFQAANYLCTLEVKGRGGRSIHDAWKGDPKAFLGLSVPGFPNFFMMYGPNTNGGSVTFLHERQAAWILGTVKQMRRRKAGAAEVRQDLFERFNRWVDKGNAGKAWVTGGCNHNYYFSPAGRVVTQWPYSSALYWLLSTVLRPFAYVFERRPALEPVRAQVRSATTE